MVVATPTKTEQRRRRALDGLTLRDLISNWEFHNQTEGKSPHTGSRSPVPARRRGRCSVN